MREEYKVSWVVHIIKGVFLVAAFAASVGACAQRRVPGTFRELQPAVKPGTPLSIDRTDGRQVKGVLGAVSGSTLRLQTGDGLTVELPEAEVSRIAARDPLWNGLLIGAVVGAVPFVLLGEEGCTSPLAAPDCQRLSRGAGIAAFSAIGAGFGLGFDALRRKTIYQASGRDRTSLRVIPIVGPDRAGLMLSRGF